MRYRSLAFVLLGLFAGITLSAVFFRPNVKTDTVTPPASSSLSMASTIPSPTADVLSEEDTSEQLFLVTKVIDGDTIELEGGKRLRLIGIDTPETVDPRTTVQCFGKEASAKTKELLENKLVMLEKDVSETDRYGRLLRYVYLGDVFINEVLVRDGYAHASSYPPDIKHQDILNKAQKEARDANRGLWATCTSPTPISSHTTPSLSTTTPPLTTNSQTQPSTTSDCKIKGNINSSGDKIYHLPGQNFYDRTAIDESKGERWFCSESEAVSAGWRKSKS